jgi:hypothetical protein
MTEDQPVRPANASAGTEGELSPSASTATAPAPTSGEINYEDAFRKGAGFVMGVLCMAGSTGAFFLYNLISNSRNVAAARIWTSAGAEFWRRGGPLKAFE